MKKASMVGTLILLSALTVLGCGEQAASQAQSKVSNQSAENTNVQASAMKDDKVSINVTGAGASFPQPIYVQWAQGFLQSVGAQVNYQSIGSSGGVKQIAARTVDFGATDSPLSAEDLQAQGLVQFPTVIGGVVPVVNIQGIEPGQLKLTGPLLAQIYLGEITKWNDAKVAALNPDLALPDENIVTVFRADGSGTSFIFTHYLSQVSAAWKDSVGAANSVQWPTAKTGTAGKGNEGVATYVARVNNAIGYVEYAYAKQNNMSHVQLQNAAGEFVQPNQESFAAAADVDWTQTEGFGLILTNQPTKQAWPLAAATFILVHKNPANAEQTKAALQFFDWAYQQGDVMAKDLDYVPLPDALKDSVRQSWQQVVDANGVALYPSK